METKTFLMTSSFYPPYHIGGDAVHVKYLSEELVKQGHEVHVMFSIDAYKYKTNDFNESLGETKEINGVILHPLQSPKGRDSIYLTYFRGRSFYIKKKFEQLVEEIRPNIVHHHNIFFLGYDILNKQGNYINLYTAHDYWLICQKYDLMKFNGVECQQKNCIPCILLSKKIPQIWRISRKFQDSINEIDTIIAPSIFMGKKIYNWIPLKVNILHIPNFIPYPPKKIKNSEYSNYFLYCGVLEKHKGICNLLKVFKEHSKEIDAKLIIVGKGSYKEKIVKYIAENKLGDKVIILGWVSDEMLWMLYNNALALVVPSIWPENNPLVALEALSVGTPVIGTNAGGLGEIIGKIDKDLIFKGDGLEEMKIFLDNNNIYSKKKIKEVYSQWYSPESFFREIQRCFDVD